MSLAADRRETVDRVVRIALPAGMAGLTWFLFVVAAGLVLRLDSLSLTGLIPLFVLVIMAWPIYTFAPWRDGLTERVRDWAGRHRYALLVTAGLVGLVAIPVARDVAGPVASILVLPYRSTAGVFFGVSVFYRELLGTAFGTVLLRFGQWYLEVIWLYVVASALVMIGRRVRIA